MTSKTIFDRLPKQYKLGDSIIASAASGTLDVEEMQHVVDGLTKLIHAKASEDTAKRQRLERMHAAQADPKYRPIIARVSGELSRLGFEGGINAFAAEDGSLTKLDAAMTSAKMDVEKRMSLKTNLHALGLI